MLMSLDDPAKRNDILAQIINESPGAQKFNEIVQEAGGDVNLAFKNLCDKNGVKPEDVLSVLQ